MAKGAEAESRIKGVPISGGVAYARVCMFNENRHNALAPQRVPPEAVEDELKRFSDACKAVAERIDEIRDQVARDLGKAEAEIFLAQKMIAEDPAVGKKVRAAIADDKHSAEGAVIAVFDAYEERLRRLDSVYLRERASDIAEVKRRFLDALGNTRPGLRCAGFGHCSRGKRRIVVARELTPAMTVDLDAEEVRGFVSEHGGVSSHAGILARALGIPAVSGVVDVAEVVSCGTELIVDGNRGEVIVRPSADTIASYPELRGESSREPEIVEPVPGFRVLANISRAGEAALAVRARADGIGLYRTEFELLAEGRVLSEDEQESCYRRVLETMGQAPVAIRLFDLGGDKGGAFLGLPAEDNPALGFRGARLLLGRPELLAAQARAIVRASRVRPVDVIHPMVTDVRQFLALREAFDVAASGVKGGAVRHGVMFEVPSACLGAREILEVAEFGSIGTNDLFQYLFAVDRNNELVSATAEADSPVFWSLIAGLVREAGARGRPLSVCGELAGYGPYTSRLVAAGIGSVSVSVRAIPRVRLARLGLGVGPAGPAPR